jgi:hypothetical protein
MEEWDATVDKKK